MEEIAKEIGLPREEVIFALDAISDPVSLYEPVFQEGGDSICVMDQVRDEKSTDDSCLSPAYALYLLNYSVMFLWIS